MKSLKFAKMLPLVIAPVLFLTACSVFSGRETAGEYIDDAGFVNLLQV